MCMTIEMYRTCLKDNAKQPSHLMWNGPKHDTHSPTSHFLRSVRPTLQQAWPAHVGRVQHVADTVISQFISNAVLGWVGCALDDDAGCNSVGY